MHHEVIKTAKIVKEVSTADRSFSAGPKRNVAAQGSCCNIFFELDARMLVQFPEFCRCSRYFFWKLRFFVGNKTTLRNFRKNSFRIRRIFFCRCSFGASAKSADQRDASKWAAHFQNICKRIANVGGHVPQKNCRTFASKSSSTSQNNLMRPRYVWVTNQLVRPA